MRFGEIPPGALVFIDANVFIYAFAADAAFGAPCIEVLERVEFGVLQGCSSAPVLSEVAHRLMTLEACQTFGWPYIGIAQRLRKHLDQVKTLHRFRDALDEIGALGISIYPVSDRDVLRAAEMSQQHGLLSNDALIAAVMDDHGVTHLASNNEDFDRVPGITRYAPV